LVKSICEEIKEIEPEVQLTNSTQVNLH